MLEDLKKLRLPSKGYKRIVKKDQPKEDKPIWDDNLLFPKKKRGKYKTKNNDIIRD